MLRFNVIVRGAALTKFQISYTSPQLRAMARPMDPLRLRTWSIISDCCPMIGSGYRTLYVWGDRPVYNSKILSLANEDYISLVNEVKTCLNTDSSEDSLEGHFFNNRMEGHVRLD